MYIEEQKFKIFISNKKVKIIADKDIPKDNVLQPTSWNNKWIWMFQISKAFFSLVFIPK